jgi:hypothetical protein
VIQRSTITAPPDAEAVVRAQGKMLIESSLVIGGGNPWTLETRGGAFTVRGSTIDRSLPGVVDPPEVIPGEEVPRSAVSGNAVIDSSIVLGELDSGPISCTNSNVASTVVAAGPETGAIDCPAGPSRPSGNFTTPPSALFVSGPGGDYRLRAGAPAIDAGGPLAPGESATDRAGAPRVQGAGRDQGAHERTPVIVPPPPLADTIAPRLLAARFAPATFAITRASAARASRVRRGSTLRFGLSEPASVRIRIERQAAGRRSRGRCRKPVPRLRRARRCKRWVTVRGAVLSRDGLTAGSRRIAFSGRFAGRALKRGRYRAVITAIDGAGNRSSPARPRFRIVRRVL